MTSKEEKGWIEVARSGHIKSIWMCIFVLFILPSMTLHTRTSFDFWTIWVDELIFVGILAMDIIGLRRINKIKKIIARLEAEDWNNI